MVVIPAGKFVMGSPPNEVGRSDDEGPQREVVVKAPRAVGRYAVTVGEYRAFVAATGHRHEGGAYAWRGLLCLHDPKKNWLSPGFAQDDRHPVTCVSWDDAKAFAAWLSKRVGRAYRLLTEAELEYACRAGTTTPYSFGTRITAAQANFAGKYGGTVQAGSYPANRFGLQDMHGQVWEWVEDAWQDSYRGASDDASWSRPGAQDAARVLRGGSWDFDPQLRAAGRDGSTTGNRVNSIGFRLARTPGG